MRFHSGHSDDTLAPESAMFTALQKENPEQPPAKLPKFLSTEIIIVLNHDGYGNLLCSTRQHSGYLI